jgi:glucose-1-phosphate thymidylyltransferase
VSNQAVIGIYYFKDVAVLKQKLQEVLDENITNGGEYQINDGIKRMMAEGRIFKTGTVDEWMDCGNKNVTLETNGKMLDFISQDGEEQLISPNVTKQNATIIEPCFIGDNVKLVNSTVGPYVSIGANCVIENATLGNSLIQNNSTIKNAKLNQAMIGNNVFFNGEFTQISIGDYSTLE